MNTILYVIGTLAVGLVLNVLAGYCLSRKTKLGGVMSALCVFTVIFSAGQGPTFYVVDMLGLTQTRFSVILTECTMGMYMIIGAMAFRSVPEETVESAKLEGAGHLRIMFEIMLPQCFSLFMVTVLFTFVAAWNSFIGARLYNAGSPTCILCSSSCSASRKVPTALPRRSATPIGRAIPCSSRASSPRRCPSWSSCPSSRSNSNRARSAAPSRADLKRIEF